MSINFRLSTTSVQFLATIFETSHSFSFSLSIVHFISSISIQLLASVFRHHNWASRIDFIFETVISYQLGHLFSILEFPVTSYISCSPLDFIFQLGGLGSQALFSGVRFQPLSFSCYFQIPVSNNQLLIWCVWSQAKTVSVVQFTG